MDREAVDEAVARGSELLKQNKLDLAQRAFRTAHDLDPGNARILALLGLSLFRGGEFHAARPIYEDLVERTPADASHRLNLGLVYLKLNEATRAITALESSRALDPSQGRATSYLGLAYARAGRYAEAYRAFIVAGQNDLATEIEQNLTSNERDKVHQQLGRTPAGPLDPAVSRTMTPGPRTTPPSAPPPSRTRSQELAPVAAEHRAESIEPVPPPPPEPAPLSISFEPAKPRELAPLSVSLAPAPRTLNESSPEITVTLPVSAPEPPATPLSDSQQFVLPVQAAPRVAAGESMLSRALADASPSAVAGFGPRTKAGGMAPRPLSELATEELLRPDDDTETFELAASGALIMRVSDRLLARLDGVHISGGELGFEIATRRSRGHATEERFDYGGAPLHVVSGHGYLVALPGARTFVTVALDDDIFYLREDLVFAFEASLRWETGNVPGLRGKLPVVQFRGDGAIALRIERPLVRVKLPAHGVVFVEATRLAGWIGRVIPRAVVPPEGGPMGELCVECTGEGIILIEPAGKPVATASTEVVAAPPPAPPPLQPPEPPPAEATLKLDDDELVAESDSFDEI